jgi:hypothetical protein
MIIVLKSKSTIFMYILLMMVMKINMAMLSGFVKWYWDTN